MHSALGSIFTAPGCMHLSLQHNLFPCSTGHTDLANVWPRKLLSPDQGFAASLPICSSASWCWLVAQQMRAPLLCCRRPGGQPGQPGTFLHSLASHCANCVPVRCLAAPAERVGPVPNEAAGGAAAAGRPLCSGREGPQAGRDSISLHLPGMVHCMLEKMSRCSPFRVTLAACMCCSRSLLCRLSLSCAALCQACCTCEL